jgi:hypothetical protein
VLCDILGMAMGLGLAKSCPTKKRPLEQCTISSILTSVEVPEFFSLAIIINPSLNSGANGIDFIDTQETRQLTCNVRFSKTTVNTCEDATSRIPLAEVQNDVS